MYFFNRTARLRPEAMRDGVAWAVAMTEKVNQVTGLNVGLWTTMFSPANGTLAWSTYVPDMTALEDADAKLMVDEGFLTEAERGAQFLVGGADDNLAQLIHGELDPARKPQYAAVVRSVLAPGGLAKGVGAGVEIAQRATQLGGVPTAFLLATTGTYGGVAWISAAESLQELEAAEQKVNGDMDFIAYLDETAPGVFEPGVSVQEIYRKLA
jgi:hypothetical protein